MSCGYIDDIANTITKLWLSIVLKMSSSVSRGRAKTASALYVSEILPLRLSQAFDSV